AASPPDAPAPAAEPLALAQAPASRTALRRREPGCGVLRAACGPSPTGPPGGRTDLPGLRLAAEAGALGSGPVSLRGQSLVQRPPFLFGGVVHVEPAHGAAVRVGRQHPLAEGRVAPAVGRPPRQGEADGREDVRGPGPGGGAPPEQARGLAGPGRRRPPRPRYPPHAR